MWDRVLRMWLESGRVGVGAGCRLLGTGVVLRELGSGWRGGRRDGRARGNRSTTL